MQVHHLQYDGGGLRIGEFPTTRSMIFGLIDNQNSPLTLCSDASNMVVLNKGGRHFTLGPRTNPVDPSGNPDIYFIPEKGDALTFTATRSVLSWPTPFEFSILGAYAVVEAICVLPIALEKTIRSGTGNGMALRARLFRGQRMDEASDDVELPDWLASDRYLSARVGWQRQLV